MLHLSETVRLEEAVAPRPHLRTRRRPPTPKSLAGKIDGRATFGTPVKLAATVRLQSFRYTGDCQYLRNRPTRWSVQNEGT